MLFLFLAIWQVQLIAQKPELIIPVGHTGGINSADFSKDGKYILTGSSDYSAILWNRQGQKLRKFDNQTTRVFSVAFSPDDQSILIGSNSAKLLDLQGNEIIRFTKENVWGGVGAVAFSSRGDYILTGEGNGQVTLWKKDGQKVRTLSGHTSGISGVAFSPNDDMILSGSRDKTAILWNMDGEKGQVFTGHTDRITSVAFSPDGQSVLTGSADKTVILWGLDGNVKRIFSDHSEQVNSVAFSPDGRYIVTGGNDAKAILRELQNDKVVRLNERNDWVEAVAFSPDGKSVLGGFSYGGAALWDLQGERQLEISGNRTELSSSAISPDNKYVFTSGSDINPTVWDVESGVVQQIEGHKHVVPIGVFSDDSRYLLTGSYDRTAILWDLKTMEPTEKFQGHQQLIRSVAIAPDASHILTGSNDGKARLWTRDGELVKELDEHSKEVKSVAFSPNNDYFLTASQDGSVIRWDRKGNKLKQYSEKGTATVNSVTFSPDGQYILAGKADQAVLWGLDGNEISTFDGHREWISSACFSPDGKYVLTGSGDGTAILWKRDGTKIRSLEGHQDIVSSAAFSKDGKYILTRSKDNSDKIWSADGNEIASLFSLKNGEWVVVEPSGRFDASQGAMRQMYFVQGLEVIQLEQLVKRFHEPGLLSKLMGFNDEPKRDVAPMNKKLALYPEVSLKLEGQKLSVTLHPREGGIGRVSLWIGVKEVVSDLDPNQSTSIVVDLDQYKDRFIEGQPTAVGVEAWNQEGNLVSQRHSQSFTLGVKAKGPGNDNGSNEKKFDIQKMRLFGLCVGTGDYSGGTALDLSYAEQDARQIANALELAGKKLFLAAPPEIKLLTTCKGCPDSSLPSKKNIKAVLEDIASKAGPQDVLVLYLSGHGKTYDDTWYYLTYEMDSDILADPEVRDQRAISSKEFHIWLAKMLPQKQVVMIDACNSGKLNQDLALLSKKNIPSSQIRALNELAKTTGLYVISASTADQVSYEASPYGMGLLTYGLLQGMQGAALEEEEHINVSLLLDYAKKTVPNLASYISKKQTPMTYSPEGSEPFPIGRVTPEVKQSIQLPEPKPMFTRARLGNAGLYQEDDLKLSTLVNATLRNYNYKGQQALLIFVEGEGLPQAYSLTGSYTVSGGSVEIKAAVFRGLSGQREQVGEEITLSGSTSGLEGLSKTLIEEAYNRYKKNK